MFKARDTAMIEKHDHASICYSFRDPAAEASDRSARSAKFQKSRSALLMIDVNVADMRLRGAHGYVIRNTSNCESIMHGR